MLTGENIFFVLKVLICLEVWWEMVIFDVGKTRIQDGHSSGFAADL